MATTADITTGTTVVITRGFATNMTGHVQVIEDLRAEGESLGRRYLVDLTGYGHRWFPADFVELYVD